MNTTEKILQYKEYNLLTNKLKKKTITKSEKKRLYILAFGEDYIKANDKGRIKEYIT